MNQNFSVYELQQIIAAKDAEIAELNKIIDGLELRLTTMIGKHADRWQEWEAGAQQALRWLAVAKERKDKA